MVGADRYFPNRYFAPRYWPKIGDDAVVSIAYVLCCCEAQIYASGAVEVEVYRPGADEVQVGCEC